MSVGAEDFFLDVPPAEEDSPVASPAPSPVLQTPTPAEPMVRFRCPTCRATLEVAARKAGEKGICGSCGQRVQLPAPNRTVMGAVLPSSLEESWTDRLEPQSEGSVGVAVAIGVSALVGLVILVIATLADPDALAAILGVICALVVFALIVAIVCCVKQCSLGEGIGLTLLGIGVIFVALIALAAMGDKRRSTSRPLNYCWSCGYTWFPRGRDYSSCCPRCGRAR